MLTDDLIERTARAIEDARCPHREGPYGGYDYGYRGDPVEGGRYVIRDFRDPRSDDWGRWVHQTDDQELHDATFKRMTEHHIARAAIAIIAPAMLDMAADWLLEAADQAAEDLGDRLFEINRDQRTKNVFAAQPYFDAVADATLALKAQFQTETQV